MPAIHPSDHDVYLFHEGSLFLSYYMFGSRPLVTDGDLGVQFCVWAPHAESVYIVGDFNDWDGTAHPMRKVRDTGIWTRFIPHIGAGTLYKYRLVSRKGQIRLKSDPYAFYSEVRPQTASMVYDLNHFPWTDEGWRERKHQTDAACRPMNIYEVHLGTWKRRDQEDFCSYQQLAEELVPYAAEMGFTHLELLPLSEHPFDRSWGYQTTGFYSVTSRYGTPDDFKHFVNTCHRYNLGVILDWVPGHFCKDDHGLRLFDGTPLYEYADPRKAEKPLWGTLSFDFGKPEVQSFLISNALFWLDIYHIDGLRMDAVASMLDLNFDKPRGQWMTNGCGGTENLEAIGFMKKLNRAVQDFFPQALLSAEDSSDWPLVTGPVRIGGLGFDYKWNMGWMNDMLKYMSLDPIYRKDHHHLITFSLMYAFSEQFILPLSHDEVVHGKKSLLNKMPGDYWQKFAGLRLFYGYFFSHPGKKLLFMGGEFAQFAEWKDQEQLDWLLLDYDMHRRMHHYCRSLHHFYLSEPALWERDTVPEGFEWMDADNARQSIISFLRRGRDPSQYILIVCNFTPCVHHNYRIGVPEGGRMAEVFNSDEGCYGGSGQTNEGFLQTEAVPYHDRKYSIQITVPPLGVVLFKRVLSITSGDDD